MHFFIDAAQLPGEPVVGSYDLWLVCASYVIASVSAYVALVLLSRIRAATSSKIRQDLRLAATVSLGSGVWAMHFVGMLAFTLPHELRYDPLLTILSMVVILAVTYVAIRRIGTDEARLSVILTSGVITGFGIAAMHYIGMAAMRMDAVVYYRVDIFLLSIAIGIIAAIVAFWVGMRYFSRLTGTRAILGMIAAAIMGFAIVGMHYTGMAATTIIPNHPNIGSALVSETSGFTLDRDLVTTVIIALMIIVLCISTLIAATDLRMTSRRRLALMSLVLAGIAMLSAGTVLIVVYDATFELQQERMLVGIKMQSRLIDAVARFDTAHSVQDVVGGATAATLEQVRDAQSRWHGFGDSGELYLVRKSGDTLEYITKPRLYPDGMSLTTSLLNVRDVAALRALEGSSGTVVASDYRGVRVLAGYGPVDELGAGMVIKLDMSEFREPFIQAGTAAGIGTLLLIGLGLWLARDISEPVVQELLEKHRLEIELEFARQIQQDLLADVPPLFDGYEFAAKSIPARFVGGDFYDFRVLSEGTAAMIIGDVSGKGVSAALHMARLISDFRSASEINPSPVAILRSMNQRLYEDARNGMFASAVCLLIDCNRHVVSIANAGHQPPLLRNRNGDVEEIARPSGPPLGVLADSDYQMERTEISDGQLVLLYTDGITETRNARRQDYGLVRLRRLLAGHQAGPDKMLDAVENAIAAFAGDIPKFDDLTLLAFARNAEQLRDKEC